MTNHRNIALIILFLALPTANGEVSEDANTQKIRKIPAISLLPDGSELEGVVLPRYNDNLQLTGSLRADKLTLVSPEIVQGDNVYIKLIDPDRSDEPTRITLGSATLNQISGIITAEEDITIHAARFTATGSALHLAFEDGRGFVSGPATTNIKPQQKTAMQPPATPRRPMLLATATLGVTIAASSMAQSKPPAPSADDLPDLRKQTATSPMSFQAETNETRQNLAETEALSRDISNAANTFLLNQVLEQGEAIPAPPKRGESKPLEIEATPEDTRILSDGGFYFDSEAGILVYLQNVRVSDPRFTLDGADELKIIFAKKPQTEKNTQNKKNDDLTGEFAAGVGDVERIIATGRVRFNQRQPQDGKPPVEASGALFNYDIAKGEIILSGGYPWVRQGGYYARALQPNLNLRIRRDGSFVTEGNWDSGQNIRR